jgi:hypothetical protein
MYKLTEHMGKILSMKHAIEKAISRLCQELRHAMRGTSANDTASACGSEGER